MTIEVYAFPSPNNFKVLITLELLGLDYKIHEVDITKGEQFQESFLKLNPAAVVPFLIDGSNEIGESINIVEYLISTYDKENKYAVSRDTPEFWKFNGYLYAHATGLSVCHDNVFYSAVSQPCQKNAADRFRQSVLKQYKLVEQRLVENGTGYLFGDHLTIADIITFPHTVVAPCQNIDLSSFPTLQKWIAKVGEEPCVKRAYERLVFTPYKLEN